MGLRKEDKNDIVVQMRFLESQENKDESMMTKRGIMFFQ